MGVARGACLTVTGSVPSARGVGAVTAFGVIVYLAFLFALLGFVIFATHG